MFERKVNFAIVLISSFIVLFILAIEYNAYFGKEIVAERKIQPKEDIQVNEKYHTVELADEELFFKAVSDSLKGNISDQALSIRGGVVPHHLLPSYIIADFFNHLSQKNIKTVILIGPNHYERGDFNVLTSEYKWKTPFGSINPNKDIISSLEKEGVAMSNEDVLGAEHSIAGILPFVKYYLPEVEIVPLILSKKMTEKDVDTLSAKLKNFSEVDDVVFVASVDFSHNLTNFEAKEMDNESLETIQDRNYVKLFSFGNEHMDSPASIALLLKILNNSQEENLNVLNNTNSGELLDDNFLPVTSYFSLIFSDEN
ncbi:MAG: AmmeMemoRadiSam system protein B [Candidatus Moranbacteria bacterium]|jgi:hypothetical protein|nr:AmmeMemoRadiSam system protein B [Candidatus Moranbacteria bacterium]